MRLLDDNYLKLWIMGFRDPGHTAETRLHELKRLLADYANQQECLPSQEPYPDPATLERLKEIYS